MIRSRNSQLFYVFRQRCTTDGESSRLTYYVGVFSRYLMGHTHTYQLLSDTQKLSYIRKGFINFDFFFRSGGWG